MSSGEEFEVDHILEQRKRKGKLEYLIRWQGFNELYDSWEPASSVSHLKNVLKAFQDKLKRSRSKSRSRSRSRGRAKSKSRSRSRSASRRVVKKSPSRASSRTSKAASTAEVAAKKEETVAVVEKEETRGRSRSRTRQQASTSKTEVVTQTSQTRRQAAMLEQKSEVVKRSVETIKATPVTTQSSSMVTRSRLAVRQVQNDQQKTSKAADKETNLRLWWFADHAVLLLFIIVSIIAISFCVESFAEIRAVLTPDLGVLRERLLHMWEHLSQSVANGYQTLLDILPNWSIEEGKPVPKSSAKAGS